MDDEIIIAVVKRLGLEVVDGREAPLGHDPKDYIENVADDRPSYAWAILRALGYLK